MGEKYLPLYTYLSDKNMKYLLNLCNKTGQTKKTCINAIFDAIRNDEELYIPKYVPKFVQRAEEYKKQKGI